MNMTKKWTPVRVGAWCVVVVAVLGGCHAAKSRDAEFVPFLERVSIEEYISRQLLMSTLMRRCLRFHRLLGRWPPRPVVS